MKWSDSRWFPLLLAAAFVALFAFVNSTVNWDNGINFWEWLLLLPLGVGMFFLVFGKRR